MFNSLNKILKKAIIIFLITTLTYSNFVLIGTNAMEGFISYALDEVEQKLEDKVITEQELITNTVYEIKGEQKRVIQVAVTTGIEEETCPIKETKITLKTNIVEETLEDIKVTELNKNSYTTGTYEIKDEKLEITLSNENETLESKEKGLDKLLITYIFTNNEENPVAQIVKPLEQVVVQTYSSKTTTKTSEVANFEDIEKNTEVLLLNIEHKDIHKTTITEGSVEYTEKLNIDLSYRKEIANIVIQDTANDFYNNEEENVEVALKYTKTKINKENLINLLGAEGTLVIKDLKTDKVLIEITKQYIEEQELNTKKEQNFIIDEETSEEETRAYITITEENVEIEYAIDVTNINLELKNIKAQSEDTIELSNLAIENTKLIYNIQNVDNLNYLKENIKYVLDEVEKTAESKITFKDTITRATLETDKTELTIRETNKVNYVVTLDTESEKAELFVNPIFIIELPASVTSVNRENSEFSVKNDSDVFTNNEVFISSLLGRQYVVIMPSGEQTAESVANGNTQITLSLELNVEEEANEGNETAKLYYQNNAVTSYESGAGFDTAEVDVALVLNSEEQEVAKNEEVQPENNNSEYMNDNKIGVEIDLGNSELVRQGEDYTYNIIVYNNSEEDIENTTLKTVISEGVTLNSVEIINEANLLEETNYNYDSQTKELSVLIPKLKAITEKFTLRVNVTVDILEEGIYSKQIDTIAYLILEDGKKYKSESVSYIVSDAFLEVKVKELEEIIQLNDSVQLELEIANKGLFNAWYVDYSINIPEEIEPQESYYQIIRNIDGTPYESAGGTVNNNRYTSRILLIPPEHTCYVVMNAIYKENVEENERITAIGSVEGMEIAWEITLEKDENLEIPEEPNKPDTPVEPGNPEEPNNPDTPVEPGNPEEPNEPNTPEEPGNPEEPKEPDAPEETEPVIEGFDLSLTQYLNKITVENSQGTTTYDYTNTNFAKVEIPAKYMNGSKLTLEYKIIVKNEGTISGYARKIVDYIPEGLKFDSKQNKDWYLADDGNIYSVALIDKLLKPGDSEELTIMLTKEMNNNNTGAITNIVEIYEASNNENVEDINSIPGDKLEEQNDMSKVEVIVAVRTGTIILYIILTIIVITIIGFGIYKIKKVTLNKKEVL